MTATAKKKVIVCGASGFIGKNILEALGKDPSYELTGTYFRSERPGFDFPVEMIEADLTQPNDVRRVLAGKDILIQAAATTSGANEIVHKPYYHVTDNAVMNSLLFREAFEQKTKHVVFFSCTVMYPTSDKALTESDFHADEGIFPKYFGVGWTKVYLEKMCEFYSQIGPTRFTVARHSNVYGPHDKFDLERSHVFGATMTKVMTAKGKTLIVWGTGEEGRDLIYVDDLVDFVKKALENQTGKFELFNVGLGEVVKVRELVQKIIDISGKNLSIEYDRTKPSLATSLFLNCEKAKQLLNWEPRHTLEQGIRKTMQWYSDNVKIL